MREIGSKLPKLKQRGGRGSPWVGLRARNPGHLRGPKRRLSTLTNRRGRSLGLLKFRFGKRRASCHVDRVWVVRDCVWVVGDGVL